jgi:hypothetical protein
MKIAPIKVLLIKIQTGEGDNHSILNSHLNWCAKKKRENVGIEIPHPAMRVEPIFKEPEKNMTKEVFVNIVCSD